MPDWRKTAKLYDVHAGGEWAGQVVAENEKAARKLAAGLSMCRRKPFVVTFRKVLFG